MLRRRPQDCYFAEKELGQMSFGKYWSYATNIYSIWGKKKCLRLSEFFSCAISQLFPEPDRTYTGLFFNLNDIK